MPWVVQNNLAVRRALVSVVVASVWTSVALVARAEPNDASPPEREAPNRVGFVADVEGGATYLQLDLLSENTLGDPQVIGSSKRMLLLGAGVGASFGAWTFGARYRFAGWRGTTLHVIGPEIAHRWFIGEAEPYVMVGGGYATGAVMEGISERPVAGFGARAGGGLEVRVHTVASVGVRATCDVLHLVRTTESRRFPDGTATPFGVSGTLVVSLHP